MLSILLLACIKIGPDEPKVTPVPPTPTPLPPTLTPVPPTPTPAPEAKPEIVNVSLCRGLTEDGRPFAETNTFSEIDAFAVSIQVANLKAENVVSARWYQEGTFIGLTERDNIVGNTYVGLSLKPQGQWQPGDYAVQVNLDGAMVETQDFAVIGAVGLPKTPPGKTPGDGGQPGAMVTYANDTLGFSINYPQDWLIDESDSSVQFSHPQDTAAVLVMVNADPQDTAQQEAEMVFERISNSLPNVELQSSEAQDNGWHGILFKYNKDGTDIVGVLFSTVSGSRGYSVVFLALQEDWDAIVPTLDEMWVSFEIAAGAPGDGNTVGGDEVLIVGIIIDADAQRGIPNAYFVILKEGVTVKQYIDSGNDETLIHAVAQTDKEGTFITNIGVKRGTTYAVFALAKGYTPVTDDMAVPKDSADQWHVTVSMQKE
ncbi:MAG: hypothetical protein JW934_00750 [Anaerolineae bacterium]|nr:hypothetical protein [Anaerolineae bacterium]